MWRKFVTAVFNRDDVMSAADMREQQKKEVLDDITQMDGIISGEIPEPVDTRADDVEPLEADGTGDELVATGEPEVEAEPVAAVVTPEPVVVVEEDKDEYGLADFVNSMAREALGKKAQPVAPVQQVQTPVQPVQPQAQAQPQQRPMTVEIPADLISENDMTEAFQDPAKMITLITQVYARAVSDAAQIALTRLPSVMQPVMAQQADLISLAKELYTNNPELNGYRDFVQYCAVKIEDKHPDWSAKQIMQEAAKEAKARLPQLKEAVARTKREASSPAFVGDQSQKGRKNSPSQGRMSALEKEIAAMPVQF